MNLTAIILAALAGFLVGGIWYGPVMGKRWMAAAGLTEQDIRSGNRIRTFGVTLLLSLLSATFLSHMFYQLGSPPFHVVMMISIGIAFGFILPAMATNNIFAKRKPALFFIDAGYWLLFYGAMGLVLAYFQGS